MAWDASQPATSSLFSSSPLRANFAAIQDQVLGKNLLGDPDFVIWAAGTSGNTPTWWNSTLSTSATIGRQTATTSITPPGFGNAVKITYSAGTEKLYQNALSTGDMTTSIKAALDGQSLSGAAHIYTTSTDCRLVLHAASSDVVSSHIQSGSWQKITKNLTVASSTLERLGMGVEISATGNTYISNPVLVLGPIPADFFSPCATYGEYVLQPSANPPSAGAVVRVRPRLPIRLENTTITTLNAPSCALSFTVRHYTGSCWMEAYTTSARLSMTGAYESATPNNNLYRAYCWDSPSSAEGTADCLLDVFVTKAPASGGKDPVIQLQYTTYDPPLHAWRANKQVYK
jgi:hypothetical protein